MIFGICDFIKFKIDQFINFASSVLDPTSWICQFCTSDPNFVIPKPHKTSFNKYNKKSLYEFSIKK